MLSVCKKHSHRARYWMDKLKLDSPYRTLLMIFFLETYLDLLLGGLVNTENDYLLNNSANWGPNGLLTVSDQFSIIVGNIIYITCMIFPIFVMFVLESRRRSIHKSKAHTASLDFYWADLYNGMRTTDPGYLHYYAVFLVRKQVYGLMVFHLYEE